MTARARSVTSQQAECLEKAPWKRGLLPEELALTLQLLQLPWQIRPRGATGRAANFPTNSALPLLLSHHHCAPHSLCSFVQETMEEKSHSQESTPCTNFCNYERLRNSELFPRARFTERLGTSLNSHKKNNTVMTEAEGNCTHLCQGWPGPSSVEGIKSVFSTAAQFCEEAADRITDHLQGLWHSGLDDAS